MPRGNVKVSIDADAKPLKRELNDANRHLTGFGKSAGKLAALGGVSVGVAGLAVAVQSVVSASIEAEKSQAKLDAQLRTIGKSSDAVKKQIDGVVQAQSLMSGFDDEALTDSFTNIVRTTGNVTKSLELNNIAMDLARAKNIDVAKAGELVAKVAGGNTGILARYGFSIEKGATASEALAVLQKRLGGQAEAYGKTQAGSIDRMNVAFENLREKLGDALAPVVTKAADSVAKFVTQMQNGTGSGGRFVDTLKELWKETQPVAKAALDVARALVRFGKAHPDVAKVAGAMLAVGAAIRAIKFASKISGLSSFLGAAKTGAGTFKKIWSGAGEDGARALASSAKDGINKARPGLKAAAASLGKGTGTAFQSAFAIAGVAAGVAFAHAMIPKLREELEKQLPGPLKKLPGIGEWLASKIPGVNNLVPPKDRGQGDGWGRRPFTGDGPGATARASANLMGASPALGHYANVGAGYGLRVSDGKRAAGTRTRDGGVSYHGSGNALDIAGSPAGMLAFAKHMVANYGGQLEELIHTPLGYSIKNGRKVAAYATADHYDHVHVADTSPGGGGKGDGSGKRVVVKGRGSWFGGPRDSMDAGKTASGGTTATPGCAIRPGDHYNSGQPYLGGVWRITAPNGKTANVRQTDIGPNQSTGRRIDITYSALGLFGYNEKNFPTDATFTAVYLGKSASASRAKPMVMSPFGNQKFALTPKGKLKSPRMSVQASSFYKKRQGVLRSVNANRTIRADQGFENAYLVASQTSGFQDDYATAVRGRDNALMRVRQYQYGLAHGDPRVTGEMLAGAIQDRDTWAGRVDEATQALVGPDRSGEFAQAAADETSVKDLLKNIQAGIDQQNQRAAIVGKLEHGVLAAAITGVVTGQIGGSAFLSMQTPGSTGQFARY